MPNQNTAHLLKKISTKISNALICNTSITAVVLGALGVTQVACANSNYGSDFFGDYSAQYSSDNGVETFKSAERAARNNDSSQLYNYENMLQGTLFAMYPEYWRLSNELEWQDPATISRYVRQYPNTAMAEKLAADFAEVQSNRSNYGAVRQVANLVTNADKSEQCALALGFNASGDSMRALAEKPKVWLNTMKQPELCKKLASELNNNPMISQNDRMDRLYRMLRTGETGDILALTGKLGIPIRYSDLSDIQLNPYEFFTRFQSQPPSAVNQYLYLYALGNMAKKSYTEAATQLNYDINQDNQRPRRLLDDKTRRYAYRTLAVRRMNHNTDDGFSNIAVDWFRKSVGEPFNYEEARAYAMAAIRFSLWGDLANAINSMDMKDQQESVWQYWLARAYEQSRDSNKRSQAQQIYRQLARSHDYYGLLAKDKVGQRFSTNEMGGTQLPNISAQDSSRVMQDPHFSRAFALYQGGVSPSYANREWNWAVKQAKDRRDNNLILAAARRAYDMGWYDRAIYAIDNSDVANLAISHPLPYQASVVNYSRSVGIDPAWAYGIMRQESRFATAARSNVGASGLMQIMPDTGKFIARQLGESYNPSRVNSGDTNIRYGTWYMSYIMNKVGQQPAVATAGYNAGFSKAKRWQPSYDKLSADQYVETIPYGETREYVKHVMENATVYGNILGRPQTITQRMGTVYPEFQ